jgi:hypothetical protein
MIIEFQYFPPHRLPGKYFSLTFEFLCLLHSTEIISFRRLEISFQFVFKLTALILTLYELYAYSGSQCSALHFQFADTEVHLSFGSGIEETLGPYKTLVGAGKRIQPCTGNIKRSNALLAASPNHPASSSSLVNGRIGNSDAIVKG